MANRSTDKNRDRINRNRSQRTGSAKFRDKERSESAKDSRSRGFISTLRIYLRTNAFAQYIRKDWFVITSLIVIFLLGLFLRSYYYYDLAVDPPYPNYDYILSGNDPYYHKRVIDHVQETGGHLYRDPMLNYPISARNPYPPVYDWSVAITGMVVAPFLGMGTADATWLVLLFAPAFWGALIIFPVYFLTRNIFNKKAGLLAAFFMAIMPSHIERSPLGFSDHDAIVLFFVVTTFFFLAKSFNSLVDKRWVENWKSPRSIALGTRELIHENKIAIGFALLCGFSIGIIALIWKGFPYVMVIIAGYYIFQLIFNKFRKIDSYSLFITIVIVNFSALMISFPLAFQLGAGTWYNPFFIVSGIVIVGVMFVPTRDYPWIIVFPAIIITVLLSFTLIKVVFPSQASSLITGGGYFIKSKLYSTIAEAQAPDMSRLVFSYGPVTFYMALIGLVLAMIAIPKHWSKDYTLIVIWCALAIYMAMSAVRFMFNASPVFAILTGWMIWTLIEKVDPTLRKFKRFEAKAIYAYVGIVTGITLTLSFYITYYHVEIFTYFHYLWGLSALGIAMCLGGLYLTFRFNYYFTLILVGGFALIWFLYVWYNMPDIFYISLILLGLIVLPILLFIMFKYSASGIRIELKHIGLSVFFTFLILLPNAWFAMDSAIPYESKGEYDPQNKILGAFGHSFVSEYWLDGMRWLSEQDTELPPEERPGFVSWWDYGFWAIYLGEHPSVAENFQNGYHFAGSVISSQNETEAITLFSLRLIEADVANTNGELTKPIMIRYLDDGNENDHPNWDRVYDSMKNPSSYINEVTSNPEIYGHYTGLRPENAKYAIGKLVIYSKLNLEKIVNMLNELEHATGKSIRYFAVDSRLFPFSASNTGIFYAPIKLADKDINDYLEYLAIADFRRSTDPESELSKWEPFPENPLTTERLEEEVEERGQDYVRIRDWVLRYTDEFYNTMFYRAFIGWHGSDVGLADDGSVPGIDDRSSETVLDTYPPMQGWNMTHFKLEYRTLYYNPHNETLLNLDERKYGKDWRATSYDEGLEKKERLESDGIDNNENGEIDEAGEGGLVSTSPRSSVYFLKYYHGAIVSGQVITAPTGPEPDEAGRPVPNVRVTVLDDNMIPHDVVYTDENGWYNLTAPPGKVIVVATKGGFNTEDIRNAQLLQLEQEQLNSTNLFITDDQANRIHQSYRIHNDIRVEPGTLNGTIFWDSNSDDAYNRPREQPVANNQVILYQPQYHNFSNEIIKEKYVLTTTTDENGFYEFDRIIPGDYKVEVSLADHKITFDQELKINYENQFQTMDFGIKPGGVKGIIRYFNGTVADNVSVELFDETNQQTTMFKSLPNGSYNFEELLPGNYTMVIDKTGFKKFDTRVLIQQDMFNVTDITLVPITPVTGMTWFDRNSNGVTEDQEKLPNARITFYNHHHPELNTVIFSDKSGSFSGNLSAGNYTAYVKYQDNNSIKAGLKRVVVKSQMEPQTGINIEVSPAGKVNGILTKLSFNPVEGALIRIISDSDQSNLPVPTNLSGAYQAYLPEGKYTLFLNHVDFNTTYRFVKDFELSTDGFQLDFNVFHAWDVSGTIYWDRDSNGMFTSYWFDEPHVDEDHEDEPPDVVPPEDILGGTRQNGDGETDDLNLTGREDPALVKESLEGVRLVFTSANGSYSVESNSTGVYKVYLSQGKYSISIEDERFEDITDSVPESFMQINVNSSAPDRPNHIVKDYVLTPKTVDISGTVWFDKDSNGVRDDGEGLSGITLELSNQSLGGGIYEFTTGQQGEYEFNVIPGIYEINIDQEFTNGVRYLFHDSGFRVPFHGETAARTDVILKDINVEKFIKVNYTVELESTLLPGSELKSENLTLNIFDSDENMIEPLEAPGVDLGGFIKPGKYSLWLDYLNQGDTYVFLGSHDIDPDTKDFSIHLTKGIRINGTIYNDSANFGVIDISDWISDIEITMRPEAPQTGLIKFKSTTGLYDVNVLPDVKYDIIINSTKKENIDNKEITVRYQFHENIKITKSIYHDLELTKYINVNGFLYYNVFETELTLTEDFLTSGGDIIADGDLGTLITNGKILFTEISDSAETIVIDTVSNSTGYFDVFLKDRVKYDIQISHDGFEKLPKVLETILVSPTNSTLKLQADPSYVTLSGNLFSAEDNSTINDLHLEFILYDDDIGTLYTAENINNGFYSIDLIPEEYVIYSYTPGYTDKTNTSNIVHRSLAYFGSVKLNISEDKSLDLALRPGVMVSGITKYTNSDNKVVSDISQSKDEGKGLKIESNEQRGKKYIDLVHGDYNFYLPYGEYLITGSITAFEYDMNMTYSLLETFVVTNTTGKTTFEYEKDRDYSFEFNLDTDDPRLMVSPATTTNLTLKLKNTGNSENTINLESADNNVPEGWEVKYSSDSVVLPINGEVTAYVKFTSPADALHDNEIRFTATSEQDNTKSNTVAMEVQIPADYNYDFFTKAPYSQGITFNDTIEFTLTIKNLGNAGDLIDIVGPTVPSIWNVSIDGQQLDQLEPVPFGQDEVYKNLTMSITAPPSDSGLPIGEKLMLNLVASSENGKDTKSLPLDIVLRIPDLKVLDYTIENLKLTEANRKNITINATVTSTLASTRNVMVGLFIDGVSVDNVTLSRIPENKRVNVILSYEEASSNRGEHNIQVVIDPEDTIEETNNFNNDLPRFVTIGIPETPPEFNYRPYAFLISVVLFFVIFIAYRRWRRKV